MKKTNILNIYQYKYLNILYLIIYLLFLESLIILWYSVKEDYKNKRLCTNRWPHEKEKVGFTLILSIRWKTNEKSVYTH